MSVFFNPILLIPIGVIAISSPEAAPTVEEKVLMSAFSSFSAAQTYDRFCNEGKITKIPPTKDVNIYWYGNQQTLVALIAAPMKRRHPEEPVDQGVKRLVEIQNKIEVSVQSILNEKGCDSADAAHMAQALETFSKTPPWELFNTLVEQVKKQGGTMTELTDEEKRVPPPKLDNTTEDRSN